MRSLNKGKSMLRIVGIVVVTAVIGFTLSSCNLGALLRGLMPSFGSVSVYNSSEYPANISVNNDSRVVQNSSTEYWDSIPAETNITITATSITTSGGGITTTVTITLYESETMFLTYNGTTLIEESSSFY